MCMPLTVEQDEQGSQAPAGEVKVGVLVGREGRQHGVCHLTTDGSHRFCLQNGANDQACLCTSANPSIGKGEAGGFAVSLKPVWAT